jgi:protease I
MEEKPLKGTKVAILATDGVERVELTEPRRALEEAGAETHLVSPPEQHFVTGVPDKIRALETLEWSEEFSVDVAFSDASPNDYDALYLPGGIINPDLLRLNPAIPGFVAAFFDAGKPVASMCHGPWNIISAGKAGGRRVASWPSLKDDLENAGATWVDEEVVVDGDLVTSRNPDDIPALNREMVALFAGRRADAMEAGTEAGRASV